ncbi:hypothetical protein V5O48_012879, partial [Marasmius crinis-equi]
MACSNGSPPNTESADQSNNVHDLAAATEVPVVTLEALQDAAHLTSVPYLSSISGVALNIVQAVKTFEINKEDFIKLAGDVCGLVHDIHAECRNLMTDGKSLPKDLEAHLGQLLHIVKKIQTFVAEQSGRYPISQFLTQKSDSKAVHGYRDDLGYWLKIFGLQRDITNGETIPRIARKQEEADPEPIRYAGGSDFQTNSPGFNSDAPRKSIIVDNVAGDQHHSTNKNHSTITNSYNNVNLSGKRSP